MHSETELHKGATSLYQDQLQRGFEFLRFNDFLEDEFRAKYLQENFQKSRLVIVLCLLAVVILTLSNIYNDNETTSMMGRFGLTLMTPMLLLTFLASFSRSKIVYQWLPALSALVIGVAGSVVDVQASLAGQGYYFAGQIGWIFIIWSMLGLMFTTAAGLCAVISLIYLVCATYVGLPSEQVFFEGFMLLNVNLLGGYSCYKYEYATRRTFLESHMLEELAERDGLTGLYNRRAFDEHMDMVWRQARREKNVLTVMLIDIDHFKTYNDIYGHQAGDDALKTVAGVIATGVQRPLDFAARYGGEEFVLVLYGPATEYVSKLPEKLRKRVLSLGVEHKGSEEVGLLSVSIGVAVNDPDSERSLGGVIQMADEALYQAKEEGRNQVLINESCSLEFETGRFRTKKAV
ncbi:MAG: GGDEF domain-containing protein [Gammaproteobacteria bacterium]